MLAITLMNWTPHLDYKPNSDIQLETHQIINLFELAFYVKPLAWLHLPNDNSEGQINWGWRWVLEPNNNGTV